MIYLENKEQYKDTFYSNSFLKSSTKSDAYIEKIKSKYKFHLPLSIINDLLVGFNIMLSCCIWSIPNLSKYLEIYSIKKVERNVYKENLAKLQKYHQRNEELYNRLKELKKKIENINHL